MKTKFTLSIKKRSQPGWLIWLIIVLPFLFGLLNDFLGLPWAIRYLMDAAWAALLLLMICFQKQLELRPVRGILGFASLFLLYTAAVYLIEFQSPLYYLWGLRNNFRFYVAFLAFCLFLKSREVEGFYRLFDILFWINVPITLFQFFVMGLEGDYLGGIFGSEKGVNAYTNIFFAIVITKALVMYLQKRENTGLVAAKCLVAFLVAALAEIKFFFVEFIVILALAVLFADFTWRKLLVIVGGCALVGMGAALLALLFPNFAGFLSVEFLWETATSKSGYTSSGDLNRLNAIPQINELWLTTWGNRLFGLGLGNCDTSNIAMLNTPFFRAYGDMHYTWISYAFMYLECGWIGLIFYYGFFVMMYIKAVRVGKRVQDREKMYCMLARIVAVCCVLTTAYNASMRGEVGYMAYFVLSIPYMIEREHDTRKRREHLAEKFAAQYSVP